MVNYQQAEKAENCFAWTLNLFCVFIRLHLDALGKHYCGPCNYLFIC